LSKIISYRRITGFRFVAHIIAEDGIFSGLQTTRYYMLLIKFFL